MTAVVGVDVGTQGTKVGVYLADGTLVAHAYGEHAFAYPNPGWVEMDPGQIEDAVTSAIGAAVTQAVGAGVPATSIVAVALSGILCGPVLIADDWVPVRPIIPFLDTRAQEEVARIRRLEPIWIDESGTDSLDTYMTPATLHWVRDHEPNTYARIAKVVSLAPYVAGRLAGLRADQAFTDPTHLSGWIIGWDARSAGFSPAQLELLGIEPRILPTVVPSTSVIGHLTPAAAARTGLPPGLPIAAGAGDIMQSNLASGQFDVGQASDVAGTASLITVSVDGLTPHLSRLPGMLYSLGTLPGQSFYWGYVKAGGLSLRWFRDQVLEAGGDDGLYASLDLRAGEVPAGSDGLLFLPYLSGGGPDLADASGTWLGLVAGTDTPALWRSLLESIAFEYGSFLDAFFRNGVAVTEVLAVGGGARSPLWNQIKADVTGAPWRTPLRQDGAALANAALGLTAVGQATDLRRLIGEWVQVGPAFLPSPAAHQTYRALAETRARVIDNHLRPVFRELAELRRRSTSTEENT